MGYFENERSMYEAICGALRQFETGCALVTSYMSSLPPAMVEVQVAVGGFDDLLSKYEELVKTAPHEHHYIILTDKSQFPKDYGVAPPECSFFNAVKDNMAKITDIDEWIDRWHKTSGGSFGLTGLREYLGFSNELYAAWLKNPDAIMGLAP